MRRGRQEYACGRKEMGMTPFMEWNMNCLRAIAQLRMPALDAIMAALTQLGGETLFIVLMMVVFWCVDKRKGYALMLLGFCGTILNQAFKITFCIPRPWMLDPDFQIVEAARAGASGFSFPSVHTQNAVTAYGSLALMTERTWIKAVCFALTVLIPFSRLYLGVHTPLDVGVSLLAGWALVLLFRPVFEDAKRRPVLLTHLWLAMLVPSVLFLVYALYVRSGAVGDLTNFDTAVKNGWTMLGLVFGAILTVLVDRGYTRFETAAVWWAQILKVVLGFALVLAVRAALKAPLTNAFGENSIGDGIRYFMMIAAGGVLWPMTFGWFEHLGRNGDLQRK